MERIEFGARVLEIGGLILTSKEHALSMVKNTISSISILALCYSISKKHLVDNEELKMVCWKKAKADPRNLSFPQRVSLGKALYYIEVLYSEKN